MPCRDYESDYSSDWDRERYKAQTDKLARIACAAMEELVRQGKEDFLVLKNPEVAEWWAEHIKADRAEKARIAEKERKERVKAEALARLTDEEKELLGLLKTKKKTVKKEIYDFETEDVYEEFQEYARSDVEELYKMLKK